MKPLAVLTVCSLSFPLPAARRLCPPLGASARPFILILVSPRGENPRAASTVVGIRARVCVCAHRRVGRRSFAGNRRGPAVRPSVRVPFAHRPTIRVAHPHATSKRALGPWRNQFKWLSVDVIDFHFTRLSGKTLHPPLPSPPPPPQPPPLSPQLAREHGEPPRQAAFERARFSTRFYATPLLA